MVDNMEVYQKIMDDIVARTGGNYEDMNFTEKAITIQIMREIKEQMDKYYREQYPVVCAWAAIPIESLHLQETSPDLTRFKSEESEFEKLMRGLA